MMLTVMGFLAYVVRPLSNISGQTTLPKEADEDVFC